MVVIVLASFGGHLLHRPLSTLQGQLSASGRLTNGTNKALGRLVRYVIGGLQVLIVQHELLKGNPKQPPMLIAALSFVFVGIGTGVGYFAGWMVKR